MAVADIRYPALCIDDIRESEILREVVKKKSAKLLDLARKEIESKIKEEVIHDYWRHTSDLQIQAKKEGYNEALKNLPRWKRDDSIEANQYITVGKNGERFHYKGHSLLISDLTKLPGFKED